MTPMKIYSTQNTKLQKIADSVINNPEGLGIAKVILTIVKK